LRIVGGALGGRRFAGPRGGRIRPTSEKVREALASVLESRDAIADSTVLDLFAGTGALSFELLSRGASRSLLVDRDRHALDAIRKSAAALGIGDRVSTLALDLFGSPPSVTARIGAALEGAVALVVADPPWDEAQGAVPLLAALAQSGLTSPECLFVFEHATRAVPALPAGLATVARYRYGDTSVILASIGAAP